MERLWTPWRLSYVTGASGSVPAASSVTRGRRRQRRATWSSVRGRIAYVILNRYPYNNGHLMVVTNRHVRVAAGDARATSSPR